MKPSTETYDAIVIGSGFGGSVAALRLVEKGYRVLLLEQGREFSESQLPRTNWNLRRWMWLPWLGLRGFFSMRVMRHVTVLSGVAVGGGSITYAATLPTPKEAFFTSGDWAGLMDWESELRPHYETARRMLGVARNPQLAPADQALQQLARKRGEGHAFEATEVGIYFGKPGVSAPDPYFEGKGPERRGCLHCGGCMLGCRHGAKNTLDRNYLYLARAAGLELRSQARVVAVRALEGGGFAVEARGRGVGGRAHFRAQRVVLGAGVMGTLDLLLRMKNDPRGLPKLSDMLGRRVRTNSESFIGIISRKKDIDLSRGTAIGSIYHCGPGESVEPVRYSDGSGFFRLLMAPHVAGDRIGTRLLRLLGICLRHPYRVWKGYTAVNIARKMSILMYMRTCEGTLRLSRGRLGMRSHREEGAAPVASFPAATELAQQSARELEGVPFALLQETLFNIPTTAHVLGGAVIGRDSSSGVVDTEHRAFGYPGLYIVDGSTMSANPGVNPSLSITALAEHAMHRVPAKDSDAVGRGGTAPHTRGV